MAGDDSSDFHVVRPTRGCDIFRLRARLLSPEDSRCILSSSTTVAGRKCRAAYWPARKTTEVKFCLCVSNWPVLEAPAARKTTEVKFCLCVSNWPVLEAPAKVSTHMVLLDKTSSPAPSIGRGESRGDVSIDDVGGRFTAVKGYYTLKAEIDDIKANCVVDKDNYFDVLCSVDIEEEFPDLGHDLAIMSDKQEHTDVSFNVGEESFSAHRLVLAARSPVFKAVLYGPMAESKMTSITIQDMEASTFRSMLHYLYHGSLPDAGKTDVCVTVAEYQHLLVAADRYGIERLKKICERKLCVYGITIDSVVSMLELAEHHLCSKLKASCLDFLADGDNFKVVGTSDEYLQLMQSFPSLLVEARKRFKTPHEKPTIMEPDSHKKTRLC